MVLTTAQLTAFKIQIICHPLPIDVLPQWRLLPPLMEGSEWPEAFSQLVPQNHEFLLTQTTHFGWFGGCPKFDKPPIWKCQRNQVQWQIIKFLMNNCRFWMFLGHSKSLRSPRCKHFPTVSMFYCAFLFWIWPSHGVFSPIPSSYPRPQF